MNSRCLYCGRPAEFREADSYRTFCSDICQRFYYDQLYSLPAETYWNMMLFMDFPSLQRVCRVGNETVRFICADPTFKRDYLLGHPGDEALIQMLTRAFQRGEIGILEAWIPPIFQLHHTSLYYQGVFDFLYNHDVLVHFYEEHFDFVQRILETTPTFLPNPYNIWPAFQTMFIRAIERRQWAFAIAALRFPSFDPLHVDTLDAILLSEQNELIEAFLRHPRVSLTRQIAADRFLFHMNRGDPNLVVLALLLELYPQLVHNSQFVLENLPLSGSATFLLDNPWVFQQMIQNTDASVRDKLLYNFVVQGLWARNDEFVRKVLSFPEVRHAIDWDEIYYHSPTWTLYDILDEARQIN